METLGSKNLDTLEALQQEALTFVGTLSSKVDGATLVTLSGELGAGKTSFTQGLAKALGVTQDVTSPTFVLEKLYELADGNGRDAVASRGFARLAHIDAYRLEGDYSLAPLGFDERVRDPENLIVLEWPELVANQLPKADVAIILSVIPEGGRTISYTYA